jgi:hypothetical protein
MSVESVADADGFVRIESEWTGCTWRETGREVCTTMRRI